MSEVRGEEDLIAARAKARAEREATHVDPDNLYDRSNIVRRSAMLRAASLQIGRYEVFDPIGREWSSGQYHFTADNIVSAVMAENDALFAAAFIRDAIEDHAAAYPDETYGENLIPLRALLAVDDCEATVFRTRNLETREWSTLRFQFRRDDMVLAVMGQEEAKLFARFVGGDLTSARPA